MKNSAMGFKTQIQSINTAGYNFSLCFDRGCREKRWCKTAVLEITAYPRFKNPASLFFVVTKSKYKGLYTSIHIDIYGKTRFRNND